MKHTILTSQDQTHKQWRTHYEHAAIAALLFWPITYKRSNFHTYYTYSPKIDLRAFCKCPWDRFQLWVIFNCWYKCGQELSKFLYTFFTTSPHWKQSKPKSGEGVETRQILVLGVHQYNEHTWIWQNVTLWLEFMLHYTVMCFNMSSLACSSGKQSLWPLGWKLTSTRSCITSLLILTSLLASMSDQNSTGWFLASLFQIQDT